MDTRRRPAPLKLLRLLPLLIPLAFAAEAGAKCVDSREVDKFKVRSVNLNAMFGLVPDDLRARLASHRGEAYTAARATAYQNEVKSYLSGNPAQQKYEKLVANKLKLSASARLIKLECVEAVPPAECQQSFAGEPGGPVRECVDVTLKAYSVDVDVLNSSPYVLPFPRSALAALYGAIPRALLALNPSFDAAHDSAFGPSLGADTATDLLDLGRIMKKGKRAARAGAPAAASGGGTVVSSDDELVIVDTGRPPRATTASTAADKDPEGLRATQMLLSLGGRKSLDEGFYDTAAGLTLSLIKPTKFFQRLSADAKFDADNLPHGDGSFLRNAASAGFGTDLRLRRGPVQLVSLGARYRWSRDRFFSRDPLSPAAFDTGRGFEARAAADGLFGKGLMRAAMWVERSSLGGGRSYGRAAALAGYGKEIPVRRKVDYSSKRTVDGHECFAPYAKDPVKSEQTFGLEVLAGAGRAWGDAPEYARYLGGSQLGNFLYDELSSPGLASAPPGPLLRASRMKQAGVPAAGAQRGGTSYWHVNLNLSVPVPAWSRPLIPHDWVTTSVVGAQDPEHAAGVPVGRRVCVDLRRMIKNAVRVSGTELLIAQLARDRLNDRQRRVLRWQGRTDLNAAQQAELDAAVRSYEQHKTAVRPEVLDLFEDEVFPVTDFIADHANFFAVKPLLLFDAGSVRLPGDPLGARTRYGAGGGLQLDVVLARFELGYVFALNRLPGDRAGNLVARLLVKRFF